MLSHPMKESGGFNCVFLLHPYTVIVSVLQRDVGNCQHFPSVISGEMVSSKPHLLKQKEETWKGEGAAGLGQEEGSKNNRNRKRPSGCPSLKFL